MKILFNCLTLGKGGAERVISILSNNFSKNNEVYILVLRKGDIHYEFNNNIKIIYIQNNSSIKFFKRLSQLSILNLLKQQNEILNINPDIIISFLPEPSLKIMLIKRLNKRIKKIPTIVSVRNDPKVEYRNKIIHFCMKKLYGKANSLVLQTDEAKDFFKKILKMPMTVIPNPIDDKFLNFPLKCTEREKTIINVGRLEPQKNHKLLIDAFAELQNYNRDYILRIYGKGSLDKYLKNYIESKGLSNKVILMGQVDDLPSKIYNAGMFVLSSDYEGMPNALMEALAIGIPCISTDCPCGGPRKLIKNGTNGYLVPVGDKMAMSEAMYKLINSTDECLKFSENAISSCKKFSAIDIVASWEKEINRVLNGETNYD